MKTIIFYFKDHFLFSTKKSFYVPFLLLLLLCIFIYYQTNLHNWLNNPLRKDYVKFIFYFTSYTSVYYIISFIHGYLHKNPGVLSGVFFARSITLIGLLVVFKSSTIHTDLASHLAPEYYHHFLNRLFWLLKYPFLILLIFAGILIIRGNYAEITGIRTRNINFKPFILILLSIIPFILAVSFLPDFIEYYPKYRATPAIFSSGFPQFLFVIPYELSYGINLFSIEIIFRGFFIFTFIRFLGKGSVYPMTAIYCLFHLGKPPLECISSIVGGYILGVIALYSQSILGGTIVHIGMAWSMELSAWIQRQFAG